MKNYKVPFEYTTFFVFGLLTRVNSERKITVNQAFEVRKILLDDFYDLGLENIILNRNQTLNSFLKDYKAYVYLKNDMIYLKEDVDIKDINILLKDIKSDVTLDYSLDLFRYLKVLEPIEFIDKLNEIEKKIEKFYSIEDYDSIKKYLKIRFDIYNSFSLENDDIIEIISDLQSEDRSSKEKEYTLYPVNKTSYENSLFSDTQYRIEDMLSTPIQKAIFSDCDLYSSKIRFDIDTRVDDLEETYTKIENNEENMEYTEDGSNYDLEYDDAYDATIDHEQEGNIEYDEDSNELIAQAFFTNISYENLSRKDIIFALKYIDNINKYEKDYGKNDKLELIKKRLKYIVDNEEMNITSKNNDGIRLVLENYLNNDSQIFDEFAEESGYLLYETIVDHSDSLFLEKLLFVKTYYDLTYDNELFELFNNYEKNHKYAIIHNFIISDNPNVIVDNKVTKDDSKVKMLIIK